MRIGRFFGILSGFSYFLYNQNFNSENTPRNDDQFSYFVLTIKTWKWLSIWIATQILKIKLKYLYYSTNIFYFNTKKLYSSIFAIIKSNFLMLIENWKGTNFLSYNSNSNTKGSFSKRIQIVAIWIFFIWIRKFELGNLNEKFKLLFSSNNLNWKYYLDCCLGRCEMCDFEL